MVCLLGTNGTGKTSFLRALVEKLETRVLVITPDDIEWSDCPLNELERASNFRFDGIQRHIFDPKTTLGKIEHFQKGVIIFDDCRAYLTANTDQAIRQLIIRRRQREVDVFAVAHGFTEMPPVFFTFASEIVLFETKDNIVRRKNCLKDYERVLEVQQQVNAKAKKNPHYKEVIKY